MKIFKQEIKQIFLLDTFSKAERNNPNENVSNRLETMLNDFGINNKILLANSKEEVFEKLNDILNSDYSSSIVLQFISHGGNHGFGTRDDAIDPISVQWLEIRDILILINLKAMNKLIVNNTVPCDGFQIDEINNNGTAFYGLIASIGGNSGQAIDQNKDFYGQCIKNCLSTEGIIGTMNSGFDAYSGKTIGNRGYKAKVY
jgi:hypothetical protein